MSRFREVPAMAGASDARRIAVLIATHERTGLLATRSLPSVAAQSRPPDLLLVVDDSAPAQRPKNREFVQHLGARFPDMQVEYLENSRARGPAGAWNTGLLQLTSLESPDTLFVAVLDDDDAWEPDHLARCLEAAEQRGLDMVAAGIVRHDEVSPEGRRQSIPTQLHADSFLVGNPHIQGSNLFVRLRLLLAAGLFDERLPSTTDRDLCIRLADLGDVRFGALEQHTVHHYAETHRERVSRPRSPMKLAGLEGFWRKYESRMSPPQQDAFLQRGQSLFGWEPTPKPLAHSSGADGHDHGGTPTQPGTAAPELDFIVGIIADAGAPTRVLPLLQDLLAFSLELGVAGLDVVILENGPRPDEAHPLKELIHRMRCEGLRCWLVGLEQQRDDAARGIFGRPFERGGGRAGIGMARTLLQRYLYSFAHGHHGAVVWILDDDKRLEALVNRQDGHLFRARTSIVPHLHRFREAGVHVVLGEDTGAPPLPAASTLRGQLCDLYHNLHWMGRLAPNAPLPDRSAENARTRRQAPDYYYDLSREGGAAETPFWFVPERSGETVTEAFRRIAARLPLLLVGEPLFRPLVHGLEAGDPVQAAAPSVRRGGSTFILDIKALRDVPNVVPTLEGRATRRSDMLWALLNVHTAGRRIVRASLPVRHDRTDLAPSGLDVEGFVADLRGGALYCALEELLLSRREDAHRLDDLFFSDAELDSAVNAFSRHLHARTAMAMASFERMRGLTRAIRALLSPEGPPWAFWHAEPEGRDAVRAIGAFLDKLQVECHPTRLDALRTRLLATELATVRSFFAELRSTTEAYRDAALRSDGMREWIEEQWVQNACIQLKRMCGLPAAAQLLGRGYEGIVFTDGERVYKYFAHWKSRASLAKRDFLRSLIGRWTETRALYPLEALHEDGSHVALVYPYEPSTPYQGRHAEGCVLLLQECRQHGIVCTNITPANLRVTRQGLRLIDYGSDLEPFTQDGFQRMCRRMWLTWRWHHRPDLKQLLRQSVHDGDMPELSGMERLVQAADESSALQQLDQLLEAEVLCLGKGRVLDYGCGKGKLAARLAAHGLDVLGYDPDAGLALSWAQWRGRTRLGFFHESSRLGVEAPFSVVVCSLVLCSLEDDPAYDEVLRDLRALVRGEEGRVLLAVCNPSFVLGGNTPLQERHLPTGVAPEDTFTWEKVVAGSCQRRKDVHRSLERLRRDLLRAGLAIEALSQTHTIDLERLEPASDFLVLRLRPLPSGGPRVSLMMKTCAMEWATIEQQVRHLVGQLEGPPVFCERILVVDGRVEGFTRSYAAGDAVAHADAVSRLLREGWVDRVVRAPTDAGEVSALNARWFKVSTPATHATNGSQVASTLAGFEACTGEYVLQLDADVLICRRDGAHDYLQEQIALFEREPHALTLSLNICQEAARPFTCTHQGVPWRTEVRASLFHRARLQAALPLPNEAAGGKLAQAWYRAVDQRVLQGPWRSYRGGGADTFFIHPPNLRKRDAAEWMAILDRVEDGWIPEMQKGAVDLVGSVEEWLGPPRHEHFIFLVQGRNTPPGRFLRCLDSMLRQHRSDWGAIVIDDGSSPAHASFLTHALSAHRERFTLLRTRFQRGKLANLVWAVRHVIRSPESIVVTLDADDALLGASVLDRLAREYERGADVTVGSMLRTDKHVIYPADLDNPRASRGGNVWQHLRTFKKRLFDAVPDDHLQLEGRYVEVANDWALMLPIIELAEHPVFIPEPLYLHEPSGAGKGSQRVRREQIIAGLMAKPRLGRRRL